MIMGGVYLSYSAYFLSVDFRVIYVIMNVLMTVLYLSLGIIFIKNCRENIKLCQSYLIEMVEGEANVMRDSLMVKKTMMRWICVGSAGFCFTKILLYGIINNMQDEFLTPKYELIPQGADFLWVLIILWICRPRKQWPVYFTLSVHEMRNAEGRGGRANDEEGLMPASMLVGLIS